MAGTGRIRVGIGGWTFEPWRGGFYPPGLAQKRELEYASRQLQTIEVNGTYYGSQKRESFERWHDEAPDDFVFALKGPRFATNRRVLAEAGESVQRFVSSGITALKAKLGPINWQFMATKQFQREDFEAFLKLLPPEADGLKLRHAVEVRHDSFRDPAFIDMARAHDVAIVLSADGQFPQIAAVTAPFVYARIMGTHEEHEAGYAPPALKAWQSRAATLAAGKLPDDLQAVGKAAKPAKRDVFLYVISGFKQRNPHAAMALQKGV